MIFGGLAASGTHHAKRMLAYRRSRSWAFICVAIGWGTPLALTAAIVFSINHSLTKSALLMLAGNVASRAPIKSASFSVITGLGKYLPVAGVLVLFGRDGAGGPAAVERLCQQIPVVRERPGRRDNTGRCC